jgi:2-polyprenyl-3-methyl-5-hydroxy-6-metoxy-1,4-benzoquinol methylase
MKLSQTKRYFDTKSGYGVSKARMERIIRHSGDVRGKFILDIGCGAGAVGARLKQEGECIVHGCDISTDAIALSEQVLDKAFVFDLSENELVEYTNQSYDVVVATELIEHLFKPDVLLSQVASVIKDDGIFIVTTPNFLVWSNRIRMLFGQFKYTKTGLLDESHVHFFTYSTLHHLLKEHSFTVVQEDNVYHPKIPRFISMSFPKLFVFQMVFICKVVK